MKILDIGYKWRINKVSYCTDYPELRFFNKLFPDKKFFNQTLMREIVEK